LRRKEQRKLNQGCRNLGAELSNFKKQTEVELDAIRSQNIALKESLQKQLSTITELLQQQAQLLKQQTVVDL
jgi:hypothetical protein